MISEGTVVQPFHMAMMREIQALKSDRRHDLMSFSMALAFFALIVVFFQYLRRFSLGKVKVENKDILLMGLVALTNVLVVKSFVFIFETAFLTKFGGWVSGGIFLFAAPIALGPMLVGLVIQSGDVVWLFTAFIAIIMGMMTEMNFPYMLITLTGGIAAARGVFSCKTRNDIYWAGVRTGVVNALMISLMLSITQIDQEHFVREILVGSFAGFLGGIFSSLLAMMLIPLIESIFNYTTDVKLLELSNLNHPLLKEMIVKAPGTYHHSMLVGSMVESAAEEIGANPLLGKVMCYYHDIGKMEHANYFIENQKPGQNPHDNISPYLSKSLLVAHVKDGVELGMRYKLGRPIIDGIVQHHGTTLISYFYNKAIDTREEGDAEVSDEEFRYPGPKPQFREAALCMLADSIEAAARSLDEPTPVRLQNIVRNIIQRKFMDGQLDECNLTLRDLSKVEAAFVRILLGIYHQRIDYPKAAGGGAAEAAGKSLFTPPVVGGGSSQKS
jgi:putative nucleotidyltransferase with HDIG domain